jgi:hypothetical protein
MSAIIDGMARAMFVCAWSDEEEQAGRSYPGEELLDVAPETPPEAVCEAWRLAGHFEALNRGSLWVLLNRALRADGETSEEAQDNADEQADDFGHYLAMRAMGHGVCWEDDHVDFCCVYPEWFEYMPD